MRAVVVFTIVDVVVCSQAAIDEAIITGSDEKDPLIQMANALLGDMKEEYDQMMAKKAAEAAAERERLSKVRTSTCTCTCTTI